MRKRIPVNKELIPYGFDIILGAQKYNLKFFYNKTADLFTIRVKRGTAVVCYEPIVYGVPLFADVYKSGTFPMLKIDPIDESDTESVVTWENFGETVFLTIDDGKD